MEPAREVLHDEQGYWLIGDGIHDPNVESACGMAHMSHVLDSNPHVNELAAMTSGTQAEWCGEHWHRRLLEYLPDDEPFEPLELRESDSG
jgi:hypothetical protein